MELLLAASRGLGNNDLFILAILGVILLVTEIAFFYIPGVSLSTLFIALGAIHFGFVPVFLLSLVTILPAHFILRKDISMFAADIVTLAPMVAFASEFGALTVGFIGWGFFGVAMSVVKWGVAIGAGFMFGRNMTKRIREIILEPIGSFVIFYFAAEIVWKFLF